MKYRIYNKARKKYVDKNVGMFVDMNGTICGTVDMGTFTLDDDEQDNFIVEQFTGKQDKNGVDIYIGDIVSTFKSVWCPSYDDEENFEELSTEVTIDNIEAFIFGIRVDSVGEVEVMGNIHDKEKVNEI